jgi:hypothetical protein
MMNEHHKEIVLPLNIYFISFIRPIRYVELISNIIPVLNMNKKLRVCIYFRNVNLATLRDEYLMPMDDMLIDLVARKKKINFMDGHLGYYYTCAAS